MHVLAILSCRQNLIIFNWSDSPKFINNNILDILTIDNLDAVIEALWGARARWNDIGRKIGVDAGTLATMRGTDSESLREILSHWLRGVYKPGEQNSTPRTWRTLIEALRARAVNEEAMANKLEREKYPYTS
jgi:hypothetical protein